MAKHLLKIDHKTLLEALQMWVDDMHTESRWVVGAAVADAAYLSAGAQLDHLVIEISTERPNLPQVDVLKPN